MGKVILITGASSGIGAATAKKLAAQGHVVYGAARRVQKMDALKKIGVKTIKMDVTKHDQVVAGVKQVLDEQGRIDVLVNNAGFGLYGAVEDISLDKAKYQFDVNLFGLADVTKAVVPAMRKQKSGLIINTSSVGGKVYMPFGAWYHASKHALEGWSDCLRLELEPFGINVAIVEPGMIATEFNDVVAAPMFDFIDNSEYADKYRGLEKAIAGEGSSFPSSPASDIADVIAKAVSARKPKTRYLKGAMAKPMLLMRRLLGDRGYDWMLRRSMGA